jgi:hypothetical protein
MEKITRLNIGEHLLKKQLEIVNKTFDDAKADDMWFFNWTITQEQHDQLKEYSIPLIKKIFKCNKTRAESVFGWFDLEFGLRVKD